MGENYPPSTIWTVVIVLYIISLAISIIYLCYYVNCGKTSLILLILCIIYFSLFIFLNIIAIFDLVFNRESGLEKFFKIIKNFYLIFSLVTKVLGFVIFNIWINYLESGYSTNCKKLCDAFKRICYKIKKIPKRILIIASIVLAIIIPTLLILLIIFRKHFGMTTLNYFSIFFDMYAIVEIYMCVGFFLVQSIKDCKRQKNSIMVERYYIYSQTEVINKAEKYFSKIKEKKQELEKLIQTIDKNNPPSYFDYAQKKCKQAQEILNSIKPEDIEANISNNNNYHDNNIINKTNNNNIKSYNYNNVKYFPNSNPKNETDPNKNNNTNSHTAYGLETFPQNNLEILDKEKKNNKTKKNMEEELQENIRKFKNNNRKLQKMKKICKDFAKEREKDLDYIKTKKGKACFCIKYTIIFLAFFMVILTDFLIPIICYADRDMFQDLVDSDKYQDDDETTTTLVIGLIILIPLYFLCSSYTVIVVYSITRRKYITGDFLYGKHMNDNLSLVKTVKSVCGYSFALIYCNLYFWVVLNREGNYYGKPLFFEKIIIPDYIVIRGISIYMIVKIIIIVVSLILYLKFENLKFFENDLAVFNRNYYDDKFNDENAKINFQTLINKKNYIVDYLGKTNFKIN